MRVPGTLETVRAKIEGDAPSEPDVPRLSRRAALLAGARTTLPGRELANLRRLNRIPARGATIHLDVIPPARRLRRPLPRLRHLPHPRRRRRRGT